jgi:hypothetical protein
MIDPDEVEGPESFDIWINQEHQLADMGQRNESMIRALIEVAQIAEGCLCWFRSQGIQASAADIVAMSALVMDRAKLKEQEAEEGREAIR